MTETELNGVAGLTQAEAAARLAAEGYNELPTAARRDLPAIALEVIREPMFLLLVAAGAIYLALGDLNEALVLLASVFVVMGITIYQERKTERALEALRDLTSPRAFVVRDGGKQRIAGREVVRGDILIVKEGDRVPADAVLLDCHDLKADESLLTGESVSVRKQAWDRKSQIGRPGGDDLPFVFSGTMLVQGQGVAEVVATGARTEIGKIGRALQRITMEATPLQRETRWMVQRIALFAIVLAVLVALLHVLLRGAWLDGLLAGITLAMAILPEEFPVVLTVFLALGAWRISQSRVLTRRVPAIETLGAATVLCVDKTGTLTMNRMMVRSLAAGEQVHEVVSHEEALPARFFDVLEYAILASEINPFDPMERAIHDLGERHLGERRARHAVWQLAKEYPLSPQLLAHTHIWRATTDGEDVVAVKGAPEAVARLCRLDPEIWARHEAQVRRMAEDGLRVLGVARARVRAGDCPETQEAFAFEWLGLLGLADPVRPTVKSALADCYTAGIRVIMITGDYPVTAQAIARSIGLTPCDEVITGSELAAMGDAELHSRMRRVNVFARVVPEQKLRLVEALKANGEVVAMTGDGVNDAPALKAAHIGVAMGARGTDVAREAASLVLLEDDFDSIVHAVRLGRRIYRNIRNAMSYLLAVHVPIAGMAFVPLMFGWPMAFFPLHIVFFEFVIDPACSIAFEAEPIDDEVMKRPPRSPGERMFGLRTVAVAVLQGAVMLLSVALVYGFALARGAGEAEARAMTFTTIVLGNLGLILANRSTTRSIFTTLRFPNPALWWVIGGTLGGIALSLYVPYLRNLFRFAPLHLDDLGLCLGAALFGLLWYEGYKAIRVRGKT
ncbi:MAG: ATPase [Betaproteobacteria bacterium RIFCSPLOWO2_12_FULL_62_58]|nr:MAG: ATPase [Betaproteobacteria bacterium RIFCSPLOWO2_12_FULL_62_58]